MRLAPKLVALLFAFLPVLGGTPAAAGQGPGSRHGSFGITVHAGRAYPARPRVGRSIRTPPRSFWVPGHYEEVARRVWVPGQCRQEWVPPLVETRLDACGRPYQVVVRPGHWRTVQEPGRYVTELTRVWVPGCWQRARR